MKYTNKVASSSAILLLLSTIGSCTRTEVKRAAPNEEESGSSRLAGDITEAETFGADTTTWAEYRLRLVQHAVILYGNANGRLPESLDAPIPGSDPPAWPEWPHRTDPWKREIRYEPTENGFELRSAGSDGVFNTSDDIYVLWPEPEP